MNCSSICRKLLAGALALVCWSSAAAQTPSDIEAYVETYRQIALDLEKEYGIPAPVTLAQGILESGAGKSLLTLRTNNHFGIKAYGGWTGPVFYAWDDEASKSPFRIYASAEESFRDHSLFLKNNSRYASLFLKSVYDYRGWANGLQSAGYATARNYAGALIGYIDAYRLYRVNGGVKLKPGRVVTVTVQAASESPLFDSECRQEESVESEEQKNLVRAVGRFVVEINRVRCTVLRPGETLSSLSQRYDLPKASILAYNELTDENEFQEGDIVFLEKKRNKYTGAQDFYRVKAGDTLYGISQSFGIRMASLAKMNGIGILSPLEEGCRLVLK